ncbi:leucine-rich repeat-containing protein 74A-like [Lineus longissimus]|uniref:leucine-rich repeat-containing protein 74A-like n=1 Tax=Lineus longissimus TaxID=88925 RepID=UPI002B4E5E09
MDIPDNEKGKVKRGRRGDRENVLPKVKRFQKRSLPRRRSRKKDGSSFSSEISEGESRVSDIAIMALQEAERDDIQIHDVLSSVASTSVTSPVPIPEMRDSDYDTDLAEEATAEEFDITGRKVYLDGCKRHGVVPASQITRALAGDCLKLNNLGLTTNDVIALCIPLQTNMSVSTLLLSSNRIGPKAMIYLAAMLKENINISTLDLSNNALGTSGAQLITDIIDMNGTIRVLNLADNGFEDNDAKYFAYIMRMSCLKVLNLSHNRFRENAGYILGSAIAENDTLEELDLSWNHFRLKGARALANGIMENVSIKKLDLSWNGFSNDGCRFLSKVLSENRVLKELDLSSNRITLEGVKHLCRGLLKNETLVKLKLSKNTIGTAGATKLLETIKAHPTSQLEALEMMDTYVDQTVETLISQVGKLKPKFHVKHGAMMRFLDPYMKIVRPRDAWMGDPLTLLLRYMAERNMRLADLFSQFDTDDSWTLTTAEFKKGVKQAHIPLSALQVEQLVNRLDKNRDGEIDFKEMLTGHKKHRHRERRIRQQHMELDRPRSSNASPSGSRPSSGRMSGVDSRQSISSPKGTTASHRGSISSPRDSISNPPKGVTLLGGSLSPRGSISSPQGTALLGGFVISPRDSISTQKGISLLSGFASPRGSISSPREALMLDVAKGPSGNINSLRGSISSPKVTPVFGGVSGPRDSTSSPGATPMTGSPRGSISIPQGNSLFGGDPSPRGSISRPRSSILPSLVPKPADGQTHGGRKQTLDDLALTDSKWTEKDSNAMPDTRPERQRHLMQQFEKLKSI